MQFKPTTLLCRNKNLFASVVDDELVMLDEEGGNYYGLDPVGKKIWEMLDQPCSFQSLINKLTDIYDVSSERCGQDAAIFLNDLIQNKLVIAK